MTIIIQHEVKSYSHVLRTLHDFNNGYLATFMADYLDPIIDFRGGNNWLVAYKITLLPRHSQNLEPIEYLYQIMIMNNKY